MSVKADSGDWRNLYAAALFEDDQSKVTVRVAEAESAMVLRAKALFVSDRIDQREAAELDQSLRMLNLLKNCIAPTVREERSAA